MTARDLMTTEPVHVVESTLLEVVDQKLYAMDIRHIPVTRDGELVGMLSDRDLREYTVEEQARATAGEAMRSDLVMAHPDTEAAELVELLLEHRVGAIPIVDPIEQHLVGIVSYIDLLEALQEELS